MALNTFGTIEERGPFSSPPSGKPAGKSRRWILYGGGAALFAAMLVAGVGAWVFLHAGEWLVIEDEVAPASAIVVLSGRMPDRAIEAARLYRENVAPEVWISQPPSPAAQMAEMNIAFLGEPFYNQKVLMAWGVPADAIHVLDGASGNTAQEVEEIARACQRAQVKRVVVVTSKPHTHRVRFIWNKLIGSNPQMIVRHVRDDSFDAAHWWRNTQDALDVSREWLGLVNAWAGFVALPGRTGSAVSRSPAVVQTEH